MLTSAFILLVLILSSFFSSTEAAFFSISQAKINFLAKNSKRGKILKDMSENQGAFISTIVCGNNIVNIAGTTLVTLFAAMEFGNVYLTLVTFIFTVLVIIFAEVIPKNLGERYAESLLMKTIYIIKFLMIVLKPFVFFIEQAIKIVNKFLPKKEENTVNEDEVVETMKISVEDGEMNKEFYEKFKRILTLDDNKVKNIMTPVSQMTHIKLGSLISESSNTLKYSQHSRIFVTDKDINDVKGYVLQKTMIQALADDKDELIDNYLIEPTFINEDTLLVDVINILMQTASPKNIKAQRYIAIIQDKDKNNIGVVTLEDVIEEIFGEIVDETDRTH
jgi:CBS domain containing-hemolysin-like protein